MLLGHQKIRSFVDKVSQSYEMRVPGGAQQNRIFKKAPRDRLGQLAM